MDQGAWIGVFQHPQRAVGGFFYIADAVTHLPALDGLGAAMAVKDDADERHGYEAADEAVPVPLWESLGACVEHQIARRDYRHPVERRQRKVGLSVGFG